MKDVMSPDSYVKVGDAAKYLGASSLTVRKWIRCGELKSLTVKSPKNGKNMYLIHKDELKYFKEVVMPEIYKKDRIPKMYRKNWFERTWEKIKKWVSRLKTKKSLRNST